MKVLESKPRWKLNAPALLEEIIKHSSQDIYRIPLNMMRNMLGQIGERAAELNDPKLNALMCQMAIYSVSDPYDKDYNAEIAERIMEEANL